ncbi:senescence/dehydration-associated protein At4g35985, chloroplastic-like [Camellia sinensis]|uniref:senescence/dehydration-associated protein At4g35985, chloroplastic-like n=1 Tax=Camellia sinensis TaxID=4442 RepID=UPI001036F010|nr:senescence/dehydration-associated protein At4g35985, chloroplastic-like [Camellia sinensis]XP_028093671.1 senescence/dehydration-associated protein At4g35985, chloroplastic-like [Camellia sinensis]
MYSSSSSISKVYPYLHHQYPNCKPLPSHPSYHSIPPLFVEEFTLTVFGVILHLIDKKYSVEPACRNLSILCLCQGDNIIAVLACVIDEIQWPLSKDLAAVKLSESHYFFLFCTPKESNLDLSFSMQKVSETEKNEGLLDGTMVMAVSPEDLKLKKKKEP